MRSHGTSAQFDPGWLFVLAGLTICAGGLLVPAQNDLLRTQQQRAQLQRQEKVLNQRLAAHTRFLADLDAADPTLVERLAASQLNLMPSDGTPLVIATSMYAPVTEWIDSTVVMPEEKAIAPPRTALSSLASGAHRLWFLASGVLCVFIGLLLDHSLPNVPRRPQEQLAEASKPLQQLEARPMKLLPPGSGGQPPRTQPEDARREVDEDIDIDIVTVISTENRSSVATINPDMLAARR